MSRQHPYSIFFFFNDTATTEIYTLSLHDALPIFVVTNQAGIARGYFSPEVLAAVNAALVSQLKDEGAYLDGVYVCPHHPTDRKSTRLNSSHGYISYAVFCLKKKKKKRLHVRTNNH